MTLPSKRIFRLVRCAQGGWRLAGQRLLGKACVWKRRRQRGGWGADVVDRYGRLGGSASELWAVGVDAHHHTGRGKLDRVASLRRHTGDAADANRAVWTGAKR